MSTVGGVGQQPTQVNQASADQVNDLKNKLQASTQNQPWSERFLQAFDNANIGSVLAGGGAITPGVENPFNGLSPQDAQQAKDAIYNAIQDSPLASAAWGDLYVAGINPDQAQPGSAGDTGTSTGASVGTSPADGSSSSSSSGTGAAAGTSPATGGSGGNTAGAAGGTSAATGGSAGGSLQSSSTGGLTGSSTDAGQTNSAGTTGGSLGTSAAGGVSAASGTGSFSKQQLYGLIQTALAQSPGGDNSLSGPQNLAKWDPSTAAGQKNLDSYYDGILTAQKQFYPEVPIDQFARLIVAHSAQESTLNPDIENGDGVIQANQSVRDDYAKYGTPIKDSSGNTIASPGQADSKDPGTCVALWAWRTRSSLDHGGNGPAQWGQNVGTTQSANFGNALSVWFQGPASQPFFKNGQLDTSSFHVGRIQSYFEKLGGTAADFQKLAAIPLGQS